MPIYDLGYRHWEGTVQSHARRWFIITRRGIALLIRNRKFISLLVLSMIPFIIRGAMLYAYFFSEKLNIRIPFLTVDGKFYFDFLRYQAFPIFLMLLYAGSGLISNDLRYNALQIYFSKPLTRMDYILGKLGIVGFFTLAVTLLPGLLLFILHVSFANSMKVFVDNLWMLGSIVLFSLLLALVNSMLVLALSSLSRSSRFAGLSFFAVFVFSEALMGILKAITRDSRAGLVSLQTNLWRVGEALFDVPTRFNIEPWQSFLVLAGLLAISIVILILRIRPVEVIK
jgi:ABC-type transport system involved in multi-copper enzyme maturation permease subunit